MNAVLNSTDDSIDSASRKHEVLTTTQKNRLSGTIIHGTSSGLAPYISSVEEDELVEYLSDANKVTICQVQVIAERKWLCFMWCLYQ